MSDDARLETALPIRMIGLQIALTMMLAALGFLWSAATLVSILVGGGICILANAVFAATVFGRYEAAKPRVLVGRIIGAEIGKLVLVAGFFVFVFARWEGLNVPVMLAAYFAAQVLPVMVAPYWGSGSKP